MKKTDFIVHSPRTTLIKFVKKAEKTLDQLEIQQAKGKTYISDQIDFQSKQRWVDGLHTLNELNKQINKAIDSTNSYGYPKNLYPHDQITRAQQVTEQYQKLEKEGLGYIPEKAPDDVPHQSKKSIFGEEFLKLKGFMKKMEKAHQQKKVDLFSECKNQAPALLQHTKQFIDSLKYSDDVKTTERELIQGYIKGIVSLCNEEIILTDQEYNQQFIKIIDEMVTNPDAELEKRRIIDIFNKGDIKDLTQEEFAIIAPTFSHYGAKIYGQAQYKQKVSEIKPMFDAYWSKYHE